MSEVFNECKELLIAGEINVICKYFIKWLNDNKVVTRTAKSVIIKELDKFNKHMLQYYKLKDTSSSFLDSETIQNHLDNILLIVTREGLAKFNRFVRITVESWDRDRITLNKFIKVLNEYAYSEFEKTVESACRL